MNPNTLFFWKDPARTGRYRTGVSLHSHTLHSREPLDFLPRLARLVPPLAGEIRRLREHSRAATGEDLDLRRTWWTPPLGAQAAWRVECAQIRDVCGLAPLVSITDHDTIAGCLHLRATQPSLDAPVSVEWTVPLRRSFVHLGVHNLAPEQAEVAMEEMARYTERPHPTELRRLLTWLSGRRETLVVLNHPCWDEGAIGAENHLAQVWELLRGYRGLIHALEWNGMWNWSENLEVSRIAEAAGLPVVSGGDRHVVQPNACLNLTSQSSFAGFVEEIRRDQRSTILWMPHYRQGRRRRLIQDAVEAVAEMTTHPLGWRRWCDRVFYQSRDGRERSVAHLWDTASPSIMRLLLTAAGRGRNRWLRPRLATG